MLVTGLFKWIPRSFPLMVKALTEPITIFYYIHIKWYTIFAYILCRSLYMVKKRVITAPLRAPAWSPWAALQAFTSAQVHTYQPYATSYFLLPSFKYTHRKNVRELEHNMLSIFFSYRSIFGFIRNYKVIEHRLRKFGGEIFHNLWTMTDFLCKLQFEFPGRTLQWCHRHVPSIPPTMCTFCSDGHYPLIGFLYNIFINYNFI
jgi:hypothetical protein